MSWIPSVLSSFSSCFIFIGICYVSVRYASAHPLIQGKMNFEIYYSRAREVQNEMTTLKWYIHVSMGEEEWYWELKGGLS